MNFELRTGFENMDVKAVHQYLSKESYWAKKIPYSIVNESLKNSYCIGIYHKDRQIAFARMITDYTTFAYLADVYVLEGYRNRGLSKMMLQHCMQLKWVQELRRYMLATLDAHSLYEQFGFRSPEKPDQIMEIFHPDIYQKK